MIRATDHIAHSVLLAPLREQLHTRFDTAAEDGTHDMLSFLPEPVLGFIVSILLIASTLFAACLILLCSPLKLLAWLIPALTSPVRTITNAIQENWTSNNALILRLLPDIHWEVTGLAELRRDRWYFVISNHQCWIDILAAFHILNRRVPPLKFFIKHELIYVPVIGLAIYVLDYPFMKRFSKAKLAKKPHLRGKDLETTRKACEKYQHAPVSVLNYLEGTRKTDGKMAATRSPHQHLLKPKSAGAAFVLTALGERMDCLLDLTTAYPQGVPSYWDFCCGRVRCIRIDVKLRPIPAHFCQNNYEDDPAYRAEFQQWIDMIWQEKDHTMAQLLSAPLHY